MAYVNGKKYDNYEVISCDFYYGGMENGKELKKDGTIVVSEGFYNPYDGEPGTQVSVLAPLTRQY
jgi:hypothetical protein